MGQPRASAPQPLIFPKHSPLVGAACLIFGGAALVGALVLEFPVIAQHGLWRYFGSVLAPTLIGAMVMAIGMLIIAPKGAITYFPGAQRLLFSSGFPSTRLELSSERIDRLYLFQRDEHEGEAVRMHYALEAWLREGVFVLIAETEDYELIREIGREVTRSLRIAVHDLVAMERDFPEAEPRRVAPPATPSELEVKRGANDSTMRLRVGMGGAYYPILALIGINALGLGSLLTASMASEIAGVFFGPLMLLLGGALLLTVAERGFSWDCVIQSGRSLTHLNQLGGLSWGRRTLELDGDFRLRLVSIGVRGYSLELVTASKSFIVASGATRRSRVSPERLLAIGAALNDLFGAETQRAADATAETGVAQR